MLNSESFEGSVLNSFPFLSNIKTSNRTQMANQTHLHLVPVEYFKQRNFKLFKKEKKSYSE